MLRPHHSIAFAIALTALASRASAAPVPAPAPRCTTQVTARLEFPVPQYNPAAPGKAPARPAFLHDPPPLFQDLVLLRKIVAHGLLFPHLRQVLRHVMPPFPHRDQTFSMGRSPSSSPFLLARTNNGEFSQKPPSRSSFAFLPSKMIHQSGRTS